MTYRELAKTGVGVPAIGLGTWQFQGDSALLQAGIDLGATLIDTAESYGTEEIVGKAIKGNRQGVFLATKISPRHFRRADVFASADASLKRLGTDYVDLYQLHWPNYTVPMEETMRAMEELVNMGKIRFIGVSNFMLQDLRKAHAAMSKHRIVSNQVRYNLIDRTIESAVLEYCQEHNITVIAHSPFGTSLQSIRAKDPRGSIDDVARRASKTPAQVVLNWCISKTGIITIPKSESMEHVKQNCAASDFSLSPEELRLLSASVEFRRRGSLEIKLRRIVRHAFQALGKNQ